MMPVVTQLVIRGIQRIAAPRGDHDVERLARQSRRGRLAVVHDRAAVPQARKSFVDRLGVGDLVLNDEDFRDGLFRFFGHGGQDGH